MADVTSGAYGRRTDTLVTGALLAVLAGVALWNALTYPAIGGFDAREHIEYARALAVHGVIPEGGASYTPPGFYLVANAVGELGTALGLDEPEKAAQILNALLTLGTGGLVVVLARLLFPRRPVLSWAALAFFVGCPVVLKTAAMFHPQPLAMFLSTLAFALCAAMIVRRRYGPGWWLALALVLAAAQLVRSVTIWVVGVVLFALVVAAVAQPEQRRRIRNALVLAALAVVVIPLPWYLYLHETGASAVFGRGIALTAFDNYWPTAFYVSPGLPSVVTDPHRLVLPPRFVPLLYADAWGDYFGIWSWNPPRPELTAAANRRLTVQSIVGLPLTVFAVGGWLAAAALTARRWRDAPARTLLALSPLAGLAAVLFYATRGASADGDIVKTMFMLPAVPFWSLGFGFAFDVVVARGRRFAVPAVAVLVPCGVVSLAYATYAIVT